LCLPFSPLPSDLISESNISHLRQSLHLRSRTPTAAGLASAARRESVPASPPGYASPSASASASACRGGPGDGKDRDLPLDNMFEWPVFASGRVISSSLLDAVVVMMFYNPSSLDLLDRLIGTGVRGEKSEVQIGKGNPRRYKPGYIDQLRVPPACAFKPYHCLFEHYISRGVVPMGLYRPRECKGAPLPFVHLNPFPEVRIEPDDLVYVLMPCRKSFKYHQKAVSRA
jgi:hypothetical protein